MGSVKGLFQRFCQRLRWSFFSVEDSFSGIRVLLLFDGSAFLFVREKSLRANLALLVCSSWHSVMALLVLIVWARWSISR